MLSITCTPSTSIEVLYCVFVVPCLSYRHYTTTREMGKSRKKSNRSKRRRLQHTPSSQNDDATNNRKSPNTLLRNLKHGASSLQQATLSGLLQTSNSHVWNDALLIAVRDLLLDVEIATHTLAAQVLTTVPYGDFETITASWMVVLIKCLETTAKSQTEFCNWITLNVCCLLEQNPLTLERLDVHLQERLLSLLISSCQSPYSARGVHSLLEDNLELVNHLFVQLPHPPPQSPLGKNQLLAFWSHHLSTTPTTPSLSTLHAAGGCLSCLRLVPNHTDLQSLLPQCLSVTQSALQQPFCSGVPQQQQLVETYRLYSNQRADARMEESVVNVQTQKQEPARAIARRLKQSTSEHSGKFADDSRCDYESAWHEQFGDWKSNHCEPLVLALELMVNWTHPEEDFLMRGVFENRSSSSSGIVRDVEGLFVRLQAIDATAWPEPVLDAMAHLQYLTAICLSHCLEHPQYDCRIFERLAMPAMNDAAQAAVCAAQAVGLRRHDSLRKQVSQSDLDRIFGYLNHSSDDVARHAVSMLGSLCAETHSETTNERVAKALLATGQTKPNVLADILNTFMDVYGNDDYPHVYDRLQISSCLGEFLKTFKSMVSVAELKKTMDGPQLEQNKDIIYNTGRFIQYKEGKLVEE